MKLGLQITSFTWPAGPARLGPDLADLARAADDVGFSSIWVMDHLFQIPELGGVEREMLEAYTALAFMAAHTKQARLGAMVTGVMPRHPGILAKTVTTLDVLSGGRAILGIGAGWFERELRSLGIPFPPAGERLERLEEVLQIVLQMWSDDNGPFEGKYYQLAETVNSPQSLSRPHPPILVGGSGEQKTLRLVARYADACNILGFLPPEDIRRKLDVLRRHCEAEGRDYASIEKTTLFMPDTDSSGSGLSRVLAQLKTLGALGFETAIASVADVSVPLIERFGREIIPRAAVLGPSEPPER